MNPATQSAMTALIRNGGMGGGEMLGYAARNCSLNWWNDFDTESGALLLVPVGANGSRRRIEEATATVALTNPSFETNTTGWVTFGTNTIAQSTEQARFGSNSLKCTFGDNAVFANFAGMTLTDADYTFSVYVYLPTGYDGGARLTHTGFTSATGDAMADADTGLLDQWQRLSLTMNPDAADLLGNFVVNSAGNTPTAGKFIYIDGAQVEQKSYPTSYCDGSLGTGYAWTGTAHASTSTRAASVLQIDAAQITELLSETVGSVAMWMTLEWAAGDGQGGSSPRFWSWNPADGDNRIDCFYNPTTDKFVLNREGTTTSAQVGSTATTHAAGDSIFVTCAWDASTLYVSLNGETYITNAQSAIPDLSAVNFRVGDSSAGGFRPNGIYGPLAFYNRVLTQAEVVELYAKGPAAMNMASIYA